MKMLNRLKFYIMSVFALCCFFVCTVSAESGRDLVLSFQINDCTMFVNGIEQDIDSGRNTVPLIINGRTLMPVRSVVESFGGIVTWDDKLNTVVLTLDDDSVILTIDSNVAYFNDQKFDLDVAPVIINERTMLPIRFIAESFNLGVAWEDETQTVTLVRNSLDDDEYEFLVNSIPSFYGTPYTYVNKNIPLFKPYEIIEGSFEYYSNLDDLGRCNVCMASVSEELMPTGGRESIRTITPTGWINVSYEQVPGNYLYNRCHLIGYQLTGENANERNLITGTRYLNVEGMLPFENEIDDYIELTGNSVMYRVTPLFRENNLVADGVLMEAYSIEDSGEGVSFCVFCYNVQPEIIIDYLTGESTLESKYSEVKEDTDPDIDIFVDTAHLKSISETTNFGLKY